MRKFIILFFFSLFALTASSIAQEDTLRKFDENRLEHLRSLESYNYIQSAAEPSKSTISKLLESFFSFLFSTSGVVLMVLVLLIIIGLVYRSSIKSRKGSKVVETEISIVHSDSSINSQKQLLELANKAVKNGDFKLAIRYQFVWTLKELDAQKLIKFHSEKTNLQYFRELPKDLQPIFFHLHRIFDFTWYGDYPSDKSLYDKVQELSNNLKSKVNAA